VGFTRAAALEAQSVTCDKVSGSQEVPDLHTPAVK
jgi:hypothetical protein